MAELSDRQRKAIAALMSTRNVTEAAKVSQVGERTLYRWLTLPGFRRCSVSNGDELEVLK